jgi:hypothetical protein
MDVLNKIQTQLKAPKGQYNSFGKYAYRSCEDILEALKPLLAEYGATLTLSDEIIHVGERYYIKTTATLCWEGNERFAVGHAREPESKKGMDESQITGAASSYARKYALNGLFCIDDNKDADYTNTHGHNTPNNQARQNNGFLTKDQTANIVALLDETGADKQKFLKFFHVNAVSDLPAKNYDTAVKMLEKKREAA